MATQVLPPQPPGVPLQGPVAPPASLELTSEQAEIIAERLRDLATLLAMRRGSGPRPTIYYYPCPLPPDPQPQPQPAAPLPQQPAPQPPQFNQMIVNQWPAPQGAQNAQQMQLAALAAMLVGTLNQALLALQQQRAAAPPPQPAAAPQLPPVHPQPAPPPQPLHAAPPAQPAPPPQPLHAAPPAQPPLPAALPPQPAAAPQLPPVHPQPAPVQPPLHAAPPPQPLHAAPPAPQAQPAPAAAPPPAPAVDLQPLQNRLNDQQIQLNAAGVLIAALRAQNGELQQQQAVNGAQNARLNDQQMQLAALVARQIIMQHMFSVAAAAETAANQAALQQLQGQLNQLNANQRQLIAQIATHLAQQYMLLFATVHQFTALQNRVARLEQQNVQPAPAQLPGQNPLHHRDLPLAWLMDRHLRQRGFANLPVQRRLRQLSAVVGWQPRPPFRIVAPAPRAANQPAAENNDPPSPRGSHRNPFLEP